MAEKKLKLEIVIYFVFNVYSWKNVEKLMIFVTSQSQLLQRSKMCAKRKKQDFNGKHNITIQLKIADDEEFYLIFKLVPFFLSQKSFKDPLFEI